MAKNLSVYNRLQAGDQENGNGGKRRVSRLTQFIHATLQLFLLPCDLPSPFYLYQHGTVYRSDASKWLKKCMDWEDESVNPRDRPKTTRKVVDQHDMNNMKIKLYDVLACSKWTRLIVDIVEDSDDSV